MTQIPKFTAQNAEISGHLFENPRMGVPRRIYWSCKVHFASVSGRDQNGEDDDWPCTLNCDWITWPVADWREISGLTLKNCLGPIAVEASLYFFGQHQPLSQIELSFQWLSADRFHVKGLFRADLEDLEGHLLRGITGEFDVEARFTGLSVIPDNLFPKPQSAAEAAKALGQFADLQAYEGPQWEEWSWRFEPRIR